MFGAAELFAAAQKRYDTLVLRQRVPGASDAAKDLELVKIARGVVRRVEAAAQKSVGWPLPGVWPTGSTDPADNTTDISGAAYADHWPEDLLQHALELFDFRCYAGFEAPPTEKRKLSEAAEKYFQLVQDGAMPLGLAVDTESGGSVPFATRNRDGSSNLPEVPDMDNVLDTFRAGWDY
jgi:hypothetical protein